MNKQQAPSRLPCILSTVYLCIAMYLICLWMLPRVQLPPAPLPRLLWVLTFYGAITFAARYIHGFLHELGHLFSGLICGYHFLSFRLFSLLLIKEKGKRKLRRFRTPGAFTQCLMSPPETAAEEYPIVLPMLGAPLMNLLCGAVFGVLGVYMVHLPFIAAFLFMLAATGLQFTLLDAIPFSTGGIRSDAKNAMLLRSSAENRRNFRILFLIEKKLQEGVRLGDMPEEWFTLSSDLQMQNSFYASLSLQICDRLMEQHKFREAHSLLRHLLSIDSALTPIERSFMNCHLIFTELIGENRPQFVRELLTPSLHQFMNAAPDYLTVLRTRYVYTLLQERDPQAAQPYKDRIMEKAKNYPCPWEVDRELELIAIAEAAAVHQASPI